MRKKLIDLKKLKSLILVVIIMFLSVKVNGAEVVRLTNGEWPPYLSEKLTEGGAASHIVREAFKAVNIEVEYIYRPWKRSYKYARAGMAEGKVCHGTVVWVYTEERAKSFHYSDVVIEDVEVLFHHRNNPLQWKTVKDLQGKTIGGTAHTTYPLFEKAESQGLLRIERAGNYDTLLQRLLADRIDAVPLVKHVGNYFLFSSLGERQREKITYSETVVDERKYYILFSQKGDPDGVYLNLFNKGLREIRENGRYTAILEDLERGKYFAEAVK